jgi:hypothetical protein
MSGEASRTKGLNRLKLKQQNGGLSSTYSDRGAAMEKESVLRKKISVRKSNEKRSLENDLEAQILLNYIPPKKANLRKTSVISKNLFPNENSDLSIFNPTIQNPNAPNTSTKVTLKSDPNITINRADNTLSKTPDLWEVLVDRVITVTESRSKNSEKIAMFSITRNITTDFFDSISPSRSPIPSPAVRGTGQSSVRKPGMGTIATPRNLKSKAGSASVTVAQSISRQRNNVIDVKEKLKQIKEEKKEDFIEVYRRLLYVPTCTYAEVEGDKNTLYNENKMNNDNKMIQLRLNKMLPIESIVIKGIKLFQNIDKNIKGSSNINEDLFVKILLELGIELSSNELTFISNRFRSHTPKKDSEIDWIDFLDFLNLSIKDNNDFQKDYRPPLPTVLQSMKIVLSNILKEMKCMGVSSTQQYLSNKNSEFSLPLSPALNNPSANFLVSNNAIFNTLTLSNVGANAENVRLLGVDVSNDEMKRISKIFKYDVILFMLFLQSEDENTGLVDVEVAFMALDTIVKVRK